VVYWGPKDPIDSGVSRETSRTRGIRVRDQSEGCFSVRAAEGESMLCRAEFKRLAAVASNAAIGMLLLCCAALVNTVAGQPHAEPNDLRWDLAENFEFRWTAVDLSTKVIRGEIFDSYERTLTITGELRVFESEGLVSFEQEQPRVLSVSDGRGNAVPCQFARGATGRWYRNNVWPLDVGPLGLGAGSFTVRLYLADNPKEPVPPLLTELKGYIYFLYADDVLLVDVPFDPNGGWREFEAAPDLQICVDPATPPCPAPLEYIPVELLPGSSKGSWFFPFRPTTPVPLYRYQTWVASKSGAPVMALRDWGRSYYRDVYPLGDYAILRTELHDSVGGTSAIVPTQDSKSGVSDIRGTGCRGQMEQDTHEAYDTIRHVIAVHPVEVKIPFVLRDIPVPSFPPPPE